MKEKEQKLGQCPKCGSTDLDYGVMYPDGDMIRYETDCLVCGWTGYEWYNTTFAEYTDR